MTNWLVNPIEVDNVPIVVVSIYSTNSTQIANYELRRLAEQATQRLKALDDTNVVKVFGGSTRKIEIALDGHAMASRQTTIADLQRAVKLTNVKQSTGRTH